MFKIHYGNCVVFFRELSILGEWIEDALNCYWFDVDFMYHWMEPVMLAMAGACSSVYDLESVWLASQHDPGLTTINNVCANGLTPLCMACRINRLDYVTFLLQKGASPSYASNHIAKFPLHFASDHSNGNLDIVTLLLSIGSDVRWLDFLLSMLLHYTA